MATKPTHAELLEKYPEAKSAEYLENTNSKPGKRHVVLSTKYGEPWFGVSIQVKLSLIKQGCTVYNPNTDNMSLYEDDKEKADAAWLLSFNTNLESTKETQGFVVQIQQGVEQEKSPMQKAEEMQVNWLAVPRIGIWCIPEWAKGMDPVVAGGDWMRRAIDLAKGQWENGIQREVQMASETYQKVPGHDGDLAKRNGYLKVTFPDGEVYEGQWSISNRHGHGINRFPLEKGDKCQDVYEGQYKDGQKHGRGMNQYSSGQIYEGQFQSGVRHGQGVMKYPLDEGDKVQEVYEGEWKDDKKHGRGKLQYASGDVYEGSFENGNEHGTGKKTYADGSVMHDGEWRNGEPVSTPEIEEYQGTTSQGCCVMR